MTRRAGQSSSRFDERTALLAAAVLAAAVFILTACAPSAPPRSPALVAPAAQAIQAEPVLIDVHGLDGLRAAFDAAHGHPRVVLLLSPT